jgi:hypothetical protein
MPNVKEAQHHHNDDRLEDDLQRASGWLYYTARLAGERLQEYLQEKRGQLNYVSDRTRSTVKANPMASIAAAFVGGMIVRRLFK